MKHAEALDVLKSHWGYTQFRGDQSAIIDHILDGNHTLGLLPTGGGKSICYQVPGLLLQGWTLVISPLVALMADQQQGLERRGIESYHFKGTYTPRQLDEAFRNLRYGNYKFAFAAPERLANHLFLEYLMHASIGLIAIDEAHCISQWGFDFRPAYLNVKLLRTLHPNVPVLALTASATPRVRRDITEQLDLSNVNIVEGSVRRSNLQLQLKFTPNKERQLFRLLPRLQGSGIIYAKTRSNCELLSRKLKEEGYTSAFFHAGLSPEEKAYRAQEWQENRVQIMVATTAFGMGIDKADVQWVVHWDVPDTLEGYYQEVGRAGRGGQSCTTYTLFHQGDLLRLQQQLQDLPNAEGVSAFYNQLCSHFHIAVGAGKGERIPFDLVELANYLNLPIGTVLTNLRLLQYRGFWQFEESHSQLPQLQWRSKPAQWHSLDELDRERLTSLYRLYPQLEDEALPIYVDRVAQAWHLLPKDLERLLEKWTNRGLLHYQPKRDGSALLFLEDRPPIKASRLPKNFIDQWIVSKRERTEAMVAFLKTESCLFQELERYFGQEPDAACGTCSTCIRNYYPDPALVQQRLQSGDFPDDIWFDLNCQPTDLRTYE